MSRRDENILSSLIAAGILGAVLGALISKRNKVAGASVGAIAFAAIIASFQANQRAKKTGVPLILEENDALYKVFPDGRKRFIKNLQKPTEVLPNRFILK